MNEQKREQVVRQLTQRLHEWRLTGAARLFLDAAEPMAFLGSQIALFARPFTPHGQWRSYVEMLTEEDGWKALKRSIDEPEC